ncbi:hypothetical protein ACFQ1I_42960 [Kitasatospora arboriphila]
MRLTVTYTGADDPDGLLGQPGQYASKAAFDDTRVSDSPLAREEAAGRRRDAVSYGGAVEVFTAPEDAGARADDLDGRQQPGAAAPGPTTCTARAWSSYGCRTC